MKLMMPEELWNTFIESTPMKNMKGEQIELVKCFFFVGIKETVFMAAEFVKLPREQREDYLFDFMKELQRGIEISALTGLKNSMMNNQPNQ